MDKKTEALKDHIKEIAGNPEFVHHKWFAEWHLEIVEKIALELLDYHPEANKDIVMAMVWMHDYGKILDFDNQYETTLKEGVRTLEKLGFESNFAATVIKNIEKLDKKLELDLRESSIEVQIVSSADGCSHMIGPFFPLWWYENASKTPEELMSDNRKKLAKDWNHKITLPEARKAFNARHSFACEVTGEIPNRLIP